MFVKFSFEGGIVTVSGCWGGSMVSLTRKPEMVSKLPEGIQAEKCVNVVNVHQKWGTYDYYYDCGDIDENTLTRALARFDGPLFINSVELSKFYQNMDGAQTLRTLQGKFFAEDGRCIAVATEYTAFINHFKFAVQEYRDPPKIRFNELTRSKSYGSFFERKSIQEKTSREIDCQDNNNFVSSGQRRGSC